MSKYGFLCFVFNTITYIALLGLIMLPIIFFVDSLLVKIILVVLAFFLCGFVEQWLISRFINQFVENVIIGKKE